jgi:nitrogen regulatory protein PII
MIDSCAEKMVQVIANAALESRIKKSITKVGASGYTLFDVRGDGDTGFQSGQLEGETNILFMIVISKKLYEPLVEEFSKYTNKGHHLMVFSSDVEVMTASKFG